MKDRVAAGNYAKNEQVEVQSPMISPEPPEHLANNGAIEKCDLPPRRAWFSSRFNHLYCLICLLILVMVSVLIISVVIATRLSTVETQAEEAARQIPLSINQAVEGIKSQFPPGILLPPAPPKFIPPVGLDPVPVTAHGPEERQKQPSSEWNEDSCADVGKCTRSDFKEPPLLILSFDGFAREYLDRGVVTTLQKFASCGTTAERVIPSYPSKTFPNHYTIVTGLYPESHGIVDNYVYDPACSPNLENMKSTKVEAMWMGDPIWSVYKRQTGKNTACLYWPGCAYNASGYPPDVSPPYNKDFPFRNRFERIREWLALPENIRPGLMLGYFDQPDTAGHYQMDDDDVNMQLVEMDRLLDHFLSDLKKDGILDCINIAIVSDHGMQRLNKTVVFDHLMKQNGIISTSGVVGRIYKNGTSRHMNELLAPFSCKKGEEMRVFTRETVPNRKHYSRSSRVADIIVQGEPGTTFVKSQQDDYHLSADHGFDYHSPKMHTVFFARGPSIKKKTVVPAFQNIEYLNLWIDLLGLKHDTPNNGTLGVMDGVLATPRMNNQPTFPQIQECPLSAQAPGAKVCGSCPKSETTLLSQKLLQCSSNEAQFLYNVPQFGASHPVCYQNYCNKTLITGTGGDKTTILIENLFAGDEIKESCEVFNRKYTGDRCSTQNGTTSARRYLSANPKSEFGRIASTEYAIGEGFSNRVIDVLNDLTMDYVGRFRRLSVITGVAFDENLDGNLDIPQPNSPTHLFRILISCSGPWGVTGYCENPNDLSILSFIFPIVQKDINCLPVDKFLLEYTARVRDIELIAGLEFIPRGVPEDVALRLRTHINMQLW